LFYSYGCKEDNPQFGRKAWVADFFRTFAAVLEKANMTIILTIGLGAS
jgi:hypothetical protein